MFELENLQNNIVLVAAIAVVAGLLIGWLLTYLLIGRGPSKTELTGKLAAVEEEFETHKQSVDEHFATTSELVNELTESYVKVYKHLSEGAEQLGGVVDMRNRLTLDDGTAKPSTSEQETGDHSFGSASGNASGKVIEGALAATATIAVAQDPQSAVSDQGVEETLTELEQAQTESGEVDLALADAVGLDTPAEETDLDPDSKNNN